MPAAIRIDIHLGSFAGLYDQIENVSRRKLRELADLLAEDVQRRIMEFTDEPQDESSGMLTQRWQVSPVAVKEGLGGPWPPPGQNDPAELSTSDLAGLAKQLDDPEYRQTLLPEAAYPDGMCHVYVTCDFS